MGWLLVALIVAPLLLAVAAFCAGGGRLRSALVVAAAVVTAALAIVTAGLGRSSISFPLPVGYVSAGLELALVTLIVGIGYRRRNWGIFALGLVQLGLAVAALASGRQAAKDGPDFLLDPLATVLVLIVSIMGPAIAVYAIGYMKRHARHAPATAAGEGVFFFLLVGFLGAMNGLAVSNDLKWFSVFWEATTLCSFALIGYDGTPDARRSANWALLLNTLGGVALTAGGLVLLYGHGLGSLRGMVRAGALAPMTLLTVAAFTKSAQMPFQSWLLGAMVAPTPVSALLHSATMVKAGSYLLLRMAPGFAGTDLSYLIALAGAVTFAATSAMAVGQSNAKRVLAYSTVANLGLIIACAGINTPLAYAAGLMILCFHALSKGLLFLCVGAIEQSIGSRDIEDMGGIMRTMPATTLIAVLGMISMVAPPFGMLLSKWLAIESAAARPLVLLLVIAGSALSVLFWVKWIGRIETASHHEHYHLEHLPRTVLASIAVLAAGVGFSAFAPLPLLRTFEGMVRRTFSGTGLHLPAEAFVPLREAAGLVEWPLFTFLGVGLLAAFLTIWRVRPGNVKPPFLCSENIPGSPLSYNFRGLRDGIDTAWARSYYLQGIFSERRFTFWGNLLVGMLLLGMLGIMPYGES